MEARYRLLLPTGDIVEVEADILRRLKTLDILTSDMGIKAQGDDNLVPVPNSELTKGQLSFIIGFYRTYLRDDRGGVEAVEEEIKSGNKSWALLLNDNRALGRVARAADFLEAQEFLVFILPKLFSNIRALSIEELEAQLQQAKKRKEPFDESALQELEQETRIVRRHYKHEVLVGQLLETLLPYQLVPGIDRRIRKYADPLSMSSYTTVIQYDGGEILFAVDHEDEDEDYTLVVSVAAIDEALASPLVRSVNEIVSGDTFLAFTTEQGIVHFYGTHNELKRALINLRPFGSEPCLALWSFDTTVVALTHETLVILLKDDEQGVASRLTDDGAASSVIEFSRGGKHLLILTREGLYGIGDSETYQLGFSGGAVHVSMQIDVAGEEIEQAFAKGDHSIVLTKSGVLYATGDNSYGQLGGGYSDEDDVLLGWHLMHMGDLTAEIIRQKVRFIAGDETRTVFVTRANRLYFIGLAEHSLDSPYGEAEELYGFEGEIISVASRASEYLLLATTSGVYCFIDDERFATTGLGSSSSTSSPFKLSIPFTGNQRAVKSESNKKQKIAAGLSCCACFAEPLFVNNTRDKLFCSRFCLDKTQTVLK